MLTVKNTKKKKIDGNVKQCTFFVYIYIPSRIRCYPPVCYTAISLLMLDAGYIATRNRYGKVRDTHTIYYDVSTSWCTVLNKLCVIILRTYVGEHERCNIHHLCVVYPAWFHVWLLHIIIWCRRIMHYIIMKCGIMCYVTLELIM